MENKLKLIGRKIKFLRIENNVSQTNLAKEIGMSQTNLSNIESGRTTATIPVLFKIQKVLGCKMCDFFADCDCEVKQVSQNEKGEASAKHAIEIEDALQILKLLKNVEVKGL